MSAAPAAATSTVSSTRACVWRWYSHVSHSPADPAAPAVDTGLDRGAGGLAAGPLGLGMPATPPQVLRLKLGQAAQALLDGGLPLRRIGAGHGLIDLSGDASPSGTPDGEHIGAVLAVSASVEPDAVVTAAFRARLALDETRPEAPDAFVGEAQDRVASTQPSTLP